MAGALKIADQCYNYILFRIPLPYSYKSLTRTKHMISSCRATALHVCALISSCIVCVCCSTTYYNRAEWRVAYIDMAEGLEAFFKTKLFEMTLSP